MLTKAIKALYLLLFLLTPLIFTNFNSELFEIPKIYFIYLLTLLILTLHLFNYLKGNTPLIRRSFLGLPLLMFLTTQFVSFMFSIDRQVSFFGYYSRLNGGLLSLIIYSLLYWILIIYLDTGFRQNIIYSSLLSGFFVSNYGILEHFGIDKHLWLQDVQTRVFSTFGQPNWLAAYLCLLLPLSIHQAIASKNKILSFIFYFLSINFYLCLLFTKSKSGIIAAVISFGIYLSLNLKKHLQHSFIALTFILLALSFTINNPIKDYLIPQKLKIENSKIENLNITPSGDIRKIVWTGALNLWKQFPLFGTGPETFAYSYYWTRPASHNLTSEWEFLYNKAHNEYLNFLATTGIFGFGTYLLLIIVCLVYFIKNLSDSDLILALFCGFVSILITNISGFSISLTSLFLLFLPALALPIINNTNPVKKHPSFYLCLSLGIFSLFFLLKLLNFYLADITYAQSINFDDQNQYLAAYKSIKISLNYRPDCPVYLNKLSLYATKLALSYQAQKDTSKTDAYVNEAIKASNTAKNISPFDINLWKERSQIFYYLSTIDTKYYLEALNSLSVAAKLAPTDAKTFYLLAKFYQNISESDKAIENYQKAISLKSNYDHAYFDLGKIYYDQKKYPLAKTNFEQVLVFAPANTDAKDYLNQIATSSGTKTKSISH